MRGITVTVEAQRMQSSSEDNNTSGSYGWCSWHRAFSNTVRLVVAIEQGSGPGHSLFACSNCRGIYRLVPLADQP
ncbi:hypothetical protein [Streptomyces sp. NPDC102476]|uniref:hypothetical protein n=1 Tax=Streptomyces sp. NPDC102476 TaxID=3366181 RepID=UPI0037F44445